MQRKKQQPATTDSGSDTLSQLLEREQLFARELDAARDEADRLRRDAAAYVQDKEAECDALIRERTARLVSTHQVQLEADLRGIDADAAAEAGCFDESDRALARRLVAIVLESIGATQPSASAVSR